MKRRSHSPMASCSMNRPAPRAKLRPSIRQTLEQLDLNYFIPCQIRDHAVAVLGVGKTVDGDFLSSEDVELLFTIAGYLAIALDNAQLYSSLEQKAEQIERLKDFSENIVESLNVGVLAVDLDGAVESWNTQLERLIGVPRHEAVGRKLDEVLPSRPDGGNRGARQRRAHLQPLQASDAEIAAGAIWWSTFRSRRWSENPENASAG